MDNSKYDNVFRFMFGLLGVCIILGGLFMLISGEKISDNTIKIQAKISEIDKKEVRDYETEKNNIRFYVYVDFEYEGEKYEHIELFYFSLFMKEGKEITVYYNPDNPKDIKSGFEIKTPGIILVIMGLGFCFISFGTALIFKRKNNNRGVLIDGKKVEAVVNEIEQDMSYTVNGESPYIVYCKYQDETTGKIYSFKSGYMWTDPYTVLIPGKSTVPVYIDKKDDSRYYVDVTTAMESSKSNS